MAYGTTGQAMGGTLAGNPVSPPRQPRLVELGERFERSLSDLQTLNAQLQNIANRAMGSIPEAAGNTKDQAPGPATINRLEAYQTELDGMLQTLRGTIERLDSL